MVKLDMEMPRSCKDCIFCTGGTGEPYQCYITDCAVQRDNGEPFDCVADNCPLQPITSETSGNQQQELTDSQRKILSALYNTLTILNEELADDARSWDDDDDICEYYQPDPSLFAQGELNFCNALKDRVQKILSDGKWSKDSFNKYGEAQ